MRIIPESERKLMTRKEIDFEFDGCLVLFDYLNNYSKGIGMVIAVSDGTREDWINLFNLGQKLFKGECLIFPAIKKRHMDDCEVDIYWI